jgi:glycosyltransferase involved in cell wall biosynthesis
VDSPRLSFIIPAHNESQSILACIQSIQQLSDALRAGGWTWEIVVAADSCQDNTADLARSAGAIVTEVAHRQIAATRNSGAAASRGDWLFFIDADTLVSESAVLASCKNLEKGFAGGGALFRFDRPAPLYARMAEPLLWAFCLLSNYSGGCFIYCQRTVFDAVGGFDRTLFAAEELAFATSVKRRGKFRVVPHTVTTSARKLRLYSAKELLGMVWRILWRGPSVLNDRKNLELWYERRNETSV